MKPFNGAVKNANLEAENGLIEVTLLVPATSADDIREIIDKDLYVQIKPFGV